MLPRYHQDDRGPRRRRYAHHETAPAGAYAGILAWTSREHWLTFVVPITLAMNPTAAKRHSIDPGTLAALCRVKSGYAAPRTGRRCIVRPDVLASVLGVDKRTVQRYNAFLREVGLEVVISEGRMLTFDEKIHLWREARKAGRACSRQRGLSTETALTVTRPVLTELVHVTPGSTSGTSHRNVTFPPTPLSGGAESEPAPPAPTRRRASRPTLTPGLRLAKSLRSRLSWLHGEQPARMAPGLQRFAVAVPSWTADDVVLALADARARAGLLVGVDGDRIRTRPAIVLAYWLRQINPVEDHPRLPHLRPEDLRCGRPECDHGWITVQLFDDHGHETHAVRRCPNCRHGAWPVAEAYDDLGDLWHDIDQEPPF